MPAVSRSYKDAAVFAAAVFAAFGVRLLCVVLLQPKPVSDFGWYYARALDIVHGSGYSINGYATAFWPLGWPYVLAAIVKVFGPSVLPGEIVQAAFNAVTAGVVFLIGRSLAGRVCGLAAAGLYAFLPSAVEWSATLASEPLYTLLWALATYVWVRFPTRRLEWYALSGILLGAAALVRPSALLFWIPLCAYLLTLKRERRHPLRLAAAVAVTACATAIAVTPAIVRNYEIFGTFVLISNNGGVSLYQGNSPYATGGVADLRNREVAKLIADPRTEVEGDRLASRLAIEYMKSHPLIELRLAVRKIKALYVADDSVVRFTLRADHFKENPSPPPDDRRAMAVVWLNDVSYYAMMLFAIAGIALSAVNKSYARVSPGWRLLLALILYNTAIFAVIGGLDRYRYPTMPYFAVFAGIALATLAAWIRQHALLTGTRLKPQAEI